MYPIPDAQCPATESVKSESASFASIHLEYRPHRTERPVFPGRGALHLRVKVLGLFRSRLALGRTRAAASAEPDGHDQTEIEQCVPPDGQNRLAANKLEKLVLRGQTDVLVSALTIFENHDGRNTTDAVLTSGERGLINVELADLCVSAEGIGHLIDDRSQGATRAAPRGGKIYENGLVRRKHLVGEVDVVELENLVGCHDGAKIMPEA